MTDLDRELRAMFADDAQRAPMAPDPRAAIRLGRRRQVRVAVTALVTVAVLAFGAITGVSSLIRASERGPVPGTKQETPGFACPSGSNPDAPGPVGPERPPPVSFWLASSAFDRDAGRLLLIERGRLWAFDVCNNTWSVLPATNGPEKLVDLVWDPRTGSTIAIARRGSAWQASVYDPALAAWTVKSEQPIGEVPEGFSAAPQAVYDPVSGRVVVRDPVSTAPMFTYDVGSDTWTVLEQTGPRPPVGGTAGHGSWIHELMTYDASADRLVLYVGDLCDGGNDCAETWEFDLRTGVWTEPIRTPYVPLGWVSSGGEMVYDEATGVSFLAGFGPEPLVVTFDASTNLWTRVPGAMDVGSLVVLGDDPVNGRVLVIRGDGSRRPGDQVWAFDLATGEWTLLLAGPA